MPAQFDLICEIEPPTTPDLRRVRHQIGVLTPVTSAFLIPDNHLGRATVSSVAVAHEVEAMGGQSIACLNSRDRNLLGLQRDLLTAAAYGVSSFLCVFGDKPAAGGRTSELTVRAMVDETKGFGFRAGVVAGAGKLPAWKREADFIVAKVGFSLPDALRWRESMTADCPVYAGVMVVASAAMAARLSATVPDLAVPTALVDAVAADPRAGVEAACSLVLQLQDSGAYDGVHLVPVSRYREVAARLEASPLRR